MDKISGSQYSFEKQAFVKLLTGARMLEITYSETFSLIFYKSVNNSEGGDYKWMDEKFNLIVDAPFWVGEKNKWAEYMKKNKSNMAMDDNMLAYELVNIRFNNLVQVHEVEFLEKYLCIFLDEEKMISIAYDSDSDYSWILEEYNDKNIQEKMMIFCQGNVIYAKNIPEIL